MSLAILNVARRSAIAERPRDSLSVEILSTGALYSTEIEIACKGLL